ncbi:MAG: glutamate--tRNA ligase family protein [Chthoniobacterales bacterium]
MNPNGSYRGRLAPSPTGYLHAGHASTFWRAQERGRERDGTMVLRIENLDRARVRPEFEEALLEDLAWFGLRWQQGGDLSRGCVSHRHERLRASWHSEPNRRPLIWSGTVVRVGRQLGLRRAKNERQIISKFTFIPSSSLPTNDWPALRPKTVSKKVLTRWSTPLFSRPSPMKITSPRPRRPNQMFGLVAPTPAFQDGWCNILRLLPRSGHLSNITDFIAQKAKLTTTH